MQRPIALAVSLVLVALAAFSLLSGLPQMPAGSPFARGLQASNLKMPRVMYTADDSEGPLERYDVRAPWAPLGPNPLAGLSVQLVGWFDQLAEPLLSLGREIEGLGAKLSTFGSISQTKNASFTVDSLARLLHGHDIVIWWNWGHSTKPKIMEGVRDRFPFPNQTWVLHDWDEPYQMWGLKSS